jgi:hypothetical protein
VSKYRERSGPAVTTLLATVLMLTACSAEPPLFLESSDGGIVAVSAADSDVIEQALFEGVVTWSAAGCMVAGDGAEASLIVFPRGTEIAENVVVLPNGYFLRAGDTLAMGGAFHPPDSEDDTLAAIPAECWTDKIFYASGEVSEIP